MHNVWIVKPGGKSRGRGIQCFNNMRELVTYTQLESATPDDKYIAQKYIENPLVVLGRKFDIRQWVLVTDWNPLTVWFYDECYFRFCAEDFTLEDLSVYSHLSNNSIAKHSDHFQNGDVAEGNMWSLERFMKFLEEKFGDRGLWESKVKPAMQRAVVDSLKSAQDMIENRKNSFDMYGYDFVLDENLDVWLIEINASPSMEHSTPVTARLVVRVLDDTLDLVLNDPAAKAKKASAGDIGVGSTGMWRLCHRSQFEVQRPNFMGLDMMIDGAKMKVHGGEIEEAQEVQVGVGVRVEVEVAGGRHGRRGRRGRRRAVPVAALARGSAR